MFSILILLRFVAPLTSAFVATTRRAPIAAKRAFAMGETVVESQMQQPHERDSVFWYIMQDALDKV